MDDSHTIVDAVDADISHIFFEFNRTDLNGFFFLGQITDLNAGSKMSLLDEFLQSYGYPLSFLRHKYFTVFGVFTPSPPFALYFGLYVIEEDASGGCAHRIVIWLVAHHNYVIFGFEPGNFLHVDGLDDMLLFF